jgi:hypothetical protein
VAGLPWSFWWPLNAGGLYLHRKVYTTFLWTRFFLAVLCTISLGAAFLPCCCLLLSCSIALILFRLWQGCSPLCTGSGSSRGGCMQSHRTSFFVSSRWSVFYQGNCFFLLLQVDVQSVPTVNVLNVLWEWVFSNKPSAQQGSQR